MFSHTFLIFGFTICFFLTRDWLQNLRQIINGGGGTYHLTGLFCITPSDTFATVNVLSRYCAQSIRAKLSHCSAYFAFHREPRVAYCPSAWKDTDLPTCNSSLEEEIQFLMLFVHRTWQEEKERKFAICDTEDCASEHFSEYLHFGAKFQYIAV